MGGGGLNAGGFFFVGYATGLVIERMVAKLTPATPGKASRPIPSGWVGLEKGKLYNIQQRIAQQFEDAMRYIVQVLGYTQADVRSMNVYQFHRELTEANRQQEAQRKQAEKWNQSNKT